MLHIDVIRNLIARFPGNPQAAANAIRRHEEMQQQLAGVVKARAEEAYRHQEHEDEFTVAECNIRALCDHVAVTSHPCQDDYYYQCVTCGAQFKLLSDGMEVVSP